MTDAFLTPTELVTLTGYKLPGKQIAWLRKNGLHHWINAAGRPVVPRTLRAPQDTAANTPQLAEVR